MKAKFIKEGKEIFFQDRNGAKWSANCIDDIFLMIHLYNAFIEKAEHYKSERIDSKNYYKNWDEGEDE